jgi:hypothetical protein
MFYASTGSYYTAFFSVDTGFLYYIFSSFMVGGFEQTESPF